MRPMGLCFCVFESKCHAATFPGRAAAADVPACLPPPLCLTHCGKAQLATPTIYITRVVTFVFYVLFQMAAFASPTVTPLILPGLWSMHRR